MHGNPFWWLCLTITGPSFWLLCCSWTDSQAIQRCYQLWLRWYRVLLGRLNMYISAFLSWNSAHSCTTLTLVVWTLSRPAHIALTLFLGGCDASLESSPPPPQWCTIFVDALHSSCLHVECIIFFSCTLSMEHSTHVCGARFRVHVYQGLFAVSCLHLHFPALSPYTIKW